MTVCDTTSIDVIMARDGSGLPLPRVIKRKGKYYRILEVKRMQFSSGRQRVPVEKYLVNINGYDKFLIREGSRWHILNESEDKRIFAESFRTQAEAVAV